MSSLAGLAARTAREAGDFLLQRFGTPLSAIETKSSVTDIVTEADHGAEDLIRARLREARPDDAIVGEEREDEPGASGLRWIVDPLDGTTNFLYGIPQFAVSIACEDEDGTIAGVVFDPARGELFDAARGEGARLNGRPISTTQLPELSRALIATGFWYRPEQRAFAARLLPTILPRVRDIRRAGAAALDLAWVACGRLDGYYEAPVNRWDVAAGELLIREAGGFADSLPTSIGDGYIAGGPGIEVALRALVDAALRNEAR